MNDNRAYSYSKNSRTTRPEFKYISKWVKPKSRIVDLGCGDGSLLAQLQMLGHKCTGLDSSNTAVYATRKKGISAKLGKIDSLLPFKNNQFDYAISTVTLQMVMYPEVMLNEMKRISKNQIISFPNFAFFINRFEALFLGRFPKYSLFGYEWYSTGHIHQFSISDFETYIKKIKLRVLKRKTFVFESLGELPSFLLGQFPNMWASSVLYELKK